MKTAKFASLCTLLLFARSYLPAQGTANTSSAVAEVKQTPEGKDPLDTELPAHFEKAHDNFLKKNFKVAASEIQAAANLVKQGSVNAKDKVKEQFSRTADDLEFLAKEVEKGTVSSATKLKSAFAKTHNAISENQYVTAVEEKGKGAIQTTGKCLKSATLHLEKGIEWSDQKIKSGTKKGFDEIKEFSDNLAKGVAATPDKVGESLKWLGKEQKKLWKKLKGEPKENSKPNVKPRN